MKKLLDGNKMSAKKFYKQFRKNVGVSFVWWIKRKTTESSGGSEWYEWRDDKFILGGSAYEHPKLFLK